MSPSESVRRIGVEPIQAIDAQAELLACVRLETYGAAVERVVTIDIAGFDWNCPQHITRRFTEEKCVDLKGAHKEQYARG